MNKERLLVLAEHLEKLPLLDLSNSTYAANEPTLDTQPTHFCMAKWYENYTCGTAACIAGHAAYLWKDDLPFKPDPRKPVGRDENIFDLGKEVLGLTGAQADGLFMGYWSSKPIHAITPHEAAAQLRKMAGA